MKYFRNIALLLVSVLTALVFISCGKDFQGDIDSLNEKHTNIEQRVNSLTTQVSEVNAQLGQLSVLSAAVEQNFYVTKVVTTTNGYELVLNDGHTIVLQNGSGNTLVPTPAVSMTMLGGFYYWTMNGLLLTDAEGNPIRSTEQTPEVRFDYTTMQWVVSIDGGRTFQDVNK